MLDQRYVQPRLVHKAAKISGKGSVSALCFSKPRAINMAIATWTLQNDAITCPRCKAKLTAPKNISEGPL